MTPEQSPARRPRVWPVFVTYLAALVSAVGIQVVAALAVALRLVANGTDVKRLADGLTALLTTPAAFILLVLPAPVVIGLAALIPARLSPEPTWLRLGLVRAALPAWGYPIVAVASFLPPGPTSRLPHGRASRRRADVGRSGPRSRSAYPSRTTSPVVSTLRFAPTGGVPEPDWESRTGGCQRTGRGGRLTQRDE